MKTRVKTTVSKLGLVLALTVGVLSAETLPAAAESGFSSTIEVREGGYVELRNRNVYGDERDWQNGRERRHGWGDDDGWRRDRPGRHDDGGRLSRGRCDPWDAIDKARANGLRRADIADVSRRRIIVEGRHHGRRAAIAFANLRGCPVIARW